MMRSILAAVTTTIALTGAAQADMIHKMSPHSVDVTMDRLASAIEGAGAKVVARVDHAKAGGTVDLELRPTQVIIFGNPKIGTPAMQENQTAGLDLPLRVLAYADSEGAVHVVYHDPADLAAAHNLPADAPYIKTMTGALDKLTSKAIAAE